MNGTSKDDVIHAIQETKKLADKLKKKQKDKEERENMPIPNIIIGERAIDKQSMTDSKRKESVDKLALEERKRHAPKPPMSPFEDSHNDEIGYDEYDDGLCDVSMFNLGNEED